MTEPIISLYIREDDIAKFLAPPLSVRPEKLFLRPPSQQMHALATDITGRRLSPFPGAH